MNRYPVRVRADRPRRLLPGAAVVTRGRRSGPPEGGPDRLGIGDLMTFWAECPEGAWNVALAALLDAAPFLDARGALDRAALLADMAARVRAVPELRRLVRWTRPGEGRPLWEDDPGFDLTHHIEFVPLRGVGRPAFLDWAATWAAWPLDRHRPLWRLAFVTGFEEGAVGVVIALHHALVDGVAGAALLARLMDSPRPGPAAPLRRVWRPAQLRRDAVRGWLAATVGGVRGIRGLPGSTRAARSDLAAAVRAVRGRAPELGLPVPDGPRRRLVATSWPLADVKAVGHRYGATVNDVVLAAVAGGLRRMMAAQGAVVDGLTVRVSVPVAAPPGARNAGGTLPMVLDLPVGEPDPARVLCAVADATGALKARRDRAYPGLSGSPLMPVFLARAGTRWLRRHGGDRVNLFVTNVPGPAAPLRLRGARLREVWPIAPVVGGLPIAVTVLSYAGTLVLTVNAAPGLAGLDDVVDGARAALAGLGYGMYRVADSGASIASSASS